MKKITLLIAVSLLYIASAQAQLFTIGPKVGLTSTNMNIKESAEGFESGDAKFGYHAGLFARITIAGFYVQPEAYFHGISGSYVDPSQAADQQVEFNRNQVDVPILLGYRFLKILRVNAGPVANFQVGDISFNRDDLNNTSAQNVVDSYKESAFAFQAGIGLDISSITLDLRYQADLSSVTDIANEDYRFNHVMFTLGYKIL